MISLEDDEVSDAVNGITSEITSGASKLFINHTGTAVSEFGGSITAPDVLVDDEVYGGDWDGVLQVPTKNAVYDKIELVDAHSSEDGSSHTFLDQDVTITGTPTFGTLTVDDEAYDATDWDNDMTVPTKNAVRDKIETLGAPDENYVHIGKTSGGTEDVGGSNGTTVYIKWDLDIKTVGSDVSHDTSTNNTRIYANADGRYHIKCNFSANSDGGARTTLGMFHRVSAGSISYRGVQNSYCRGGVYDDNLRIHFNIEIEMTDGQYIEMGTFIEDTDGSYTITSEYSACDFIMRKIG
jgi:hypothetical protein